jgi:hypothetical protein
MRDSTARNDPATEAAANGGHSPPRHDQAPPTVGLAPVPRPPRLFRPGLPDPLVIGAGRWPPRRRARSARAAAAYAGTGSSSGSRGGSGASSGSGSSSGGPPARAAAGQAAALGPPSSARSWRPRPFPYRMPCPRAARSVLRVRARTSTRRQLRPVLEVRIDSLIRELPHDVCLPVGDLPPAP